ncbi:MBL fold metallo-hydrolase [Streptomyces longisporoflavus]|uniref:MBL fold metallo-hydrolase n=1 Tax=Streptomyces longisporoflavus TaxID=28044 RepID=A0ABW7R424_9ACTN
MTQPSATPHPGAPPAPAPPRLEELAPGVHAYIQPDGGWCLNNAGVLIGDDAVAVVDTAATERRARALRAAIAARTPLDVRTIVTTHHHGDHHFGNSVVAPYATVVSHEVTRAEMARRGLAMREVWPGTEWGDISLALPTLTFRERATLHVGGLTAELMHVGPAHTTSDIVVWLPEQRVLFAGDVLLPGCTPFVLMGSLSGTLEAITRLRALDPAVVVGGHGPVAGPEVLDATRDYLLWVRDTARAGLAAGLSPLQTARESDLGPYAGLRDPERLVANLHRAYVEESALPRDTEIRSAPVFGEMAQFNGGRPVACHA